jgi:hypothetical protein
MTNSCNIPEDHTELTQYGRRETRSIILQDWYQVELAQHYVRDTRPSLYNIMREKYQAELPKYPRRGLPDLIAINSYYNGLYQKTWCRGRFGLICLVVDIFIFCMMSFLQVVSTTNYLYILLTSLIVFWYDLYIQI